MRVQNETFTLVEFWLNYLRGWFTYNEGKVYIGLHLLYIREAERLLRRAGGLTYKAMDRWRR